MFIKYIVFLTTHALIMDGEILLMSNTFVLILLQCFLLYIHLAKSANQNLELSPPPNPPPSKTSGEQLKAIFIAFRHQNLELSPPPQPPPSKTSGEQLKAIFIAFRHQLGPPPPPPFPFGNTSKRYSAFRHQWKTALSGTPVLKDKDLYIYIYHTVYLLSLLSTWLFAG